MGFVDELNKHISLSRTAMHCNVRHYLRIFSTFLDLSIVNSWLLYRRDYKDLEVEKKKTLSLYKFKSVIADRIMRAYKPGKRLLTALSVAANFRHGPRLSMPSSDMRFDQTGH